MRCNTKTEMDLVAEKLSRQTEISVGASDAPRVVPDGERAFVGVELDQTFVAVVVRIASRCQVNRTAWQYLDTTRTTTAVTGIILVLQCVTNKNLCGRDGRTICGPQSVPKSTEAVSACRKVHVCHCNSLGGAT